MASISNNNPDNTDHRFIPKGEQKCIWMTAGYMAFKLCDKQFDCANCPLDMAMRTGHPDKPIPIQINQNQGKEVNPLPISQLLDEFRPFQNHPKKGLYYHPKFTWVDKINEKSVQIGIDPFLLQLLDNLHVIVLPLVGIRLHQGEYFCWLFGDYPPCPILSPINGIVTNVNTKIREHPEYLISENEKYIWLVDVNIDNFDNDKKNLMEYSETKNWRENQIGFLKKQLSSAMETEHSKIGFTLQDGGTRLNNIMDIMGKIKYYELIFKFLKKPNF